MIEHLVLNILFVGLTQFVKEAAMLLSIVAATVTTSSSNAAVATTPQMPRMHDHVCGAALKFLYCHAAGGCVLVAAKVVAVVAEATAIVVFATGAGDGCGCEHLLVAPAAPTQVSTYIAIM